MGLHEVLSGRDVVFVTHWHPAHGNHGDRLLRDASLQMFRKVGASVRAVVAGDVAFPPRLDIGPITTIVISGGGNLGGYYYPEDGTFGLRIADRYPGAPVQILPQTYVRPWSDEGRRLADRVLSRDNVWVCLREGVSWYYFDRDYHKGWVEQDTVMEYYDVPDVKKTADRLFIRRRDNESRLVFPGDAWTAWPYDEIVPRIGRWRRVVTDRLHAAILGYRLGCEVWLVANSYFKNAAYYEKWWKSESRVRFLGEQSDVESFLREQA